MAKATTTTKKKAAPKKDVKQTWKVTTVPVAGATLYTAYKLKDETKPDELGNRVHKGGLWQTKKEAENLAKLWNEEGKE